MVKCPNCLKNVPDEKFCENCGFLLKPSSENEGDVKNSWGDERQSFVKEKAASERTKICPKCGKEFPSNMNYCTICETEDGGAVSLVNKQDISKVKIRFLDVEDGEYIDFEFSVSKRFGREDFKKWYGTKNGKLSREEFLHISRRHFEIEEKSDGKFIIKDTESSNGTYLNGKLVETQKEYPLSSGDELAFYLGNKRTLTLKVILNK